MDICPAKLFELLALDTEYMGEVIPYERIPSIPVKLDASYVAVSALKESLFKKLEPQRKSRATRDTAIAAFLLANERCASWSPTCTLLPTMALIAERDFGSPHDWWYILEMSSGTMGPGASVGSRGCNSFMEKFFVNDLTTTNPALYPIYWDYVKLDPSWRVAEAFRRRTRGQPIRVVASSVTSTVPKNTKTDRTICTEPSLNMFFQRALGDYIDSVMRAVLGYDSAKQPDRNSELARQGSIRGDIGTIDLSQASDTIAWGLVQHVLPAWLVAAIEDCRSASTQVDGKTIPMHMVSSMGNGFTFPLETYLFSLVVRAVCFERNERFKTYDKATTRFGVFGDDIVVPAHLYDDVISALQDLGFIPNVSKSYNTGFFRESCGSDWYAGVNVRGVYAKHLYQVPHVYSLINRLNRFSANHRVPLRNVVRALLSASGAKHIIPCDSMHGDDCGVRYPDAPDKTGRYLALTPRVRSISYSLKKVGPSSYNHGGLLKAVAVTGSDRLPRRGAARYTSTARWTPYWVDYAWLKGIGLTEPDWALYFAYNLGM